jgi:cytochrome c-type biogenesis protein CcmH/NrfG
LNPRDVAVVRMMVDLSESAKTKEALEWHRLLAELEPADANYIDWADCALRYNEVPIAEHALGRVDEAGKKSASYHSVAGRLAQAANQIPAAEEHYAEAAKMEPANPDYQVRLASVRLRSDDPARQNEARQILEKYVADPKVRSLASRALLDQMLAKQNWREALELAKQVQGSPDATFGDKMIYLALLRQFQRPEFHSHLLTLQETAINNPDDTAHLISWLSDNSLVMIASSWIKTIPPAIAAKLPVPAAIGECYAMLHDWASLEALVAEGNWEYVEFLRLAFLSRVQRENGDLLTARNSWNSAVKATGNRPDSILMLTRYAKKWGWDSEVHDLLWVVGRGNSGQQSALNTLYQSYAASGNTRGLLNVSTRMLEISPKDPVALNNVVLLSLLLNSNMERAQVLADEAYQLQPKNPAVISTYAYALHLRGKTDEAVRLMRSLDEKTLADPSVAAYMAAMLVETEKPDDATKFIELAQTANLLPEEMALVKSARESLIRRNAEKSAPR